MDYQRKRPNQRRWLRRSGYTVVGMSAIIGTTFGIAQLKPATASVERSSLLIDTVKRDTMLREVSGRGRLVAIDITWVTTLVGGQVVRVPAEPGIEVQPETVLVELRDLNVERAVTEANRSHTLAEHEFERFRVLLDQQFLDLKAATADKKASYDEAASKADMYRELSKRGLIAEHQFKLISDQAKRNFQLLEIQIERVKNSLRTNEIQLKEKEAAVARAKDILLDRQREQKALTVRAGTAGILQQLGPNVGSSLEVGQRVGDGAVVAKITNPSRLKAVLEVEESRAGDVVIGQSAKIDTLSEIITGHVIRVAPAAQEGTVAVDVELDGELPNGARPDLSVYGTIEIERLDDVLFVTRPAYGDDFRTISLFKLAEDGASAVRATVKLGRGSVHTIQILEGLSEGDRVIVREMSEWDGVDRISLH